MTAAEATAGTRRVRSNPRVAGGLALGALALVGLVLPLVIARHHGALGAARGDDWSYLVTLFRWVDTGRLEFNNWVSMSLLGQLVLAAPIAVSRGHAIALVQAQTAVIGLVGLGALALLGRRLGLSWGAVTLAGVTIAISPLWLILSTTFMTDVPAFTISTIGLLLATVALQARPIRTPLLIAGFAVAVYAVSIRQYAIVPVIAIVLAGALGLRTDADRRHVVAFAVAVGIGAVATLAFLVWWYSVPDARALSPSAPTGRDLRTAVIKGAGFLRLAGFGLLPIICWRGPVRVVRDALAASRPLAVVAVLGTALWQATTATRYFSSQFVGNYVIRDGALSIAVLPGTRPDLMPGPLWNLLVVLGSLGAIVLALGTVPVIARLAGRVRDRDLAGVDPVTGLLGLTVFGFATAYGLAMVTGVQVYDRYALPALAIAALLILRGAPTDGTRARAVGAGLALALLGVVGINAAIDSASFDGGRWRLAQRVVDVGGWRPKQVNGGFEWVNYHRGRRGTVAARASIERLLPDGTVIRIAPYCVNLRVRVPAPGPSAGSTGAPPIASIEYVAPLRDPVRIVALRSPRPCVAPRGSTPGLGGGPNPAP
ncbi:MAG: hypothetical protein RL531_851 [Actinomycetota bacterium]